MLFRATDPSLKKREGQPARTKVRSGGGRVNK